MTLPAARCGRYMCAPSIAETKLQNRHAGNLQPVSQRVDLGSDVAEVFGEERQASQRLAKL